MLYALVDGDTVIRTAHLRSGLALWDYAARSIAWATRAATADPVAEQIHTALAASADGLTRTQLRDLFGRNQPAARVDQALAALAPAAEPTGGASTPPAAPPKSGLRPTPSPEPNKAVSRAGAARPARDARTRSEASAERVPQRP
jgi:hypothetical protein